MEICAVRVPTSAIVNLTLVLIPHVLRTPVPEMADALISAANASMRTV